MSLAIAAAAGSIAQTKVELMLKLGCEHVIGKVGGSASVDVVENAPAPDDSDVRNNGEDDAAAEAEHESTSLMNLEVIHAGVHAEFLDDEEWEDFTYDISGRLEGIAEEQSDEVEDGESLQQVDVVL
ncbi:unnamed protein product [Polarella glacialis]|uniref:Uncharacterized protein n=1 Tax=Polarella glacialis TaxID=89957 RepID=A0A813IIS4_POLGL|nr:unnamed protein product [Polarella glacialis]